MTTALSIMDMAKNKAGETDEEGKSSSFIIGQLVRLIIGFFILTLTHSLLQWINNLIF
jgi:hypothetical protein